MGTVFTILLYIIGGFILLSIIIGILGRLARFTWFPWVVMLIVCIVVAYLSSAGWGILAGLFAFGVISMCKDAVDK